MKDKMKGEMSRRGESSSLSPGGYFGVWHEERVIEMPRSNLKNVGSGFFFSLQMKLQYSQCCNQITSVDIDPPPLEQDHTKVFPNQMQYITHAGRSRANCILLLVQ